MADQIYLTDEFGKVEVSLESAPPWIISSQNNVVLISEKLATTVTQNKYTAIQLFPNPTEQHLNLSGKNLMGALIQIFNLNGQLLFEKRAASGFETINLNQIIPGIYQLSVFQNHSCHNFKLIKQ